MYGIPLEKILETFGVSTWERVGFFEIMKHKEIYHEMETKVREPVVRFIVYLPGKICHEFANEDFGTHLFGCHEPFIVPTSR